MAWNTSSGALSSSEIELWDDGAINRSGGRYPIRIWIPLLNENLCQCADDWHLHHFSVVTGVGCASLAGPVDWWLFDLLCGVHMSQIRRSDSFPLQLLAVKSRNSPLWWQPMPIARQKWQASLPSFSPRPIHPGESLSKCQLNLNTKEPTRIALRISEKEKESFESRPSASFFTSKNHSRIH